MAAIELDEQGFPVQLLNAVSQLHDAGVDPDSQKSADSRLSKSGLARRTRRVIRRRRERLQKLDKFIAAQGWPIMSLEDYENPHHPWIVRAELATTKISDPAELQEKLSVALRHIARHRGWRNPYSSTASLLNVEKNSEPFEQILANIAEKTGKLIPENTTVGQAILIGIDRGYRIRKGAADGDAQTEGLLSAHLQQSDHARELAAIFAKQELSHDLYKDVIEVVFAAKSPKGSAARKVGKDSLPGQTHLPRALKASEAFQLYRIVSVIANLRLIVEGTARPLTKDERVAVYEYLSTAKSRNKASWDEVASILKVDRGQIRGTAAMTDDGERVSARPPIHDTNAIMGSLKLKALANFWKNSDSEIRAAVLRALSNSEARDDSSEADAQLDEFLADLSEKEQEELDKISLPVGRAAYSEDSLTRLTAVMLNEGVDLSTARQLEFGIPKNWQPPAPEIGEPVGNPAVDRVLKIVARWLAGVTKKWGEPERVTIEHVRDAFSSKKKTSEISRKINERAKRNESLRENIRKARGFDGYVSRADLWRYQSITRQNGQCAYCGTHITMSNSQMDHIVPRAGQGSTNTRDNLLAVCSACNSDKTNLPFAIWAAKTSRPNVSLKEAQERIKHWNKDPAMKALDFAYFKRSVLKRLKRKTIDEEIDTRSIESVAWMANELRSRIAHKYSLLEGQQESPKVQVFAGAITSEARKAAGIEKELKYIGGVGKTRLDRRHHAVDAAVVALITPFVAQTFEERMNLRFSEELSNSKSTWKTYTGADYAHRQQWEIWQLKMQKLLQLLQDALDNDQIPVMSNIRLRLGNSRVHEDKVSALEYHPLGEELSSSLIDRASSEALWCALTRDPDYVFKKGLPANPNRTIQVNGTHYGPSEEIGFFAVKAASIPLRGGYAELGKSIHHIRIYRINTGKMPTYAILRVYAVDLQRHRNNDLFNAEIRPQTISMRKAPDTLRKAIAAEAAEYIGWVVTDDELFIDSVLNTELNEAYGDVKRWRIVGSTDDNRFVLRPSQLSSEGLDSKASNNIQKIIKIGLRISVNELLKKHGITVVRRNALGVERIKSSANLPVSWSIKKI
nr:type II CRISPR RNA-guided endonuclease Cas9 [Corynebacterium caspium]